MTRITQPDSWSCSACVVCMITGSTLKSFYEFCGHDGSQICEYSKHPEKRRGFYFQEMMGYLLMHNWYAGLLIDMSDRSEYVPETIDVDLPRDQLAILTVRSKLMKDGKHVVLWTGKEVIDPSPYHEEMYLKDYEILEWWPVYKISEE